MDWHWRNFSTFSKPWDNSQLICVIKKLYKKICTKSTKNKREKWKVVRKTYFLGESYKVNVIFRFWWRQILLSGTKQFNRFPRDAHTLEWYEFAEMSFGLNWILRALLAGYNAIVDARKSIAVSPREFFYILVLIAETFQ